MKRNAIKELKIDKSQWTPVKFGDVAFEPKETVKDPQSEGIEHVVGLEHIDSENIHLVRSENLDQSTTFTKKFAVGDVLFGRRRAYLKKAAQASFAGICSGDITVLRAKDKLLPELLPFVVQNEKFFDFAIKHSAGGLSPRVKFKDLASYEFLLPPKDYQAELSKLFYACDSVITSLHGVCEHLKRYKKSLMSELLAGRKRIGSFAGEWEQIRLDDLAVYRRGSFPQPYGAPEWYDEENGSPFVQVYDIDYNMMLKKTTKTKISKEACALSVFAPKGSLIVSIQGSIGRIAITQYDAYIDRTILIFKEFKKESSQLYLSYILEDLFYREEKKAPGATIKTITKEALSSFEIPFPPLEEQENIGACLQVVDNKIKTSIDVLCSAKQLSQSIITQVF
jgi:type I restriction enzyme S subunit